MRGSIDLEDALGLLDAGDERIDLFRRVIDVEAGTGSGGYPKFFHERLIAVMTCPHADAFAVQNAREIVRVDVADGQRDDAGTVRDARAIDRDVAQPRQLIERDDGELVLVDCYPIHPHAIEIIDRSTQADRFGDRKSTRLNSSHP